ncbi:MAG: tetratricopeptide repeat protein [Gemmatimonadaceae bacterium]
MRATPLAGAYTGAVMPTSPSAREHLDRGVMLMRSGDTGRALEEFGVAAESAATASERTEAHRRMADVHREIGAYDEAVSAARTSAAIARGAELTEAVAEAVNAEGAVHLLRGDLDAARPLLEEALALATEPRVRGNVLLNIATMAARAGDLATAARYSGEAVANYERAGYERGVLIALNNAAASTIEHGDAAAALPVLDRAGALARRLQDLDLLLLTVRNAAEALVSCGRLEEAEARVGEAIGFFVNASNTLRRAECLVILGDIHVRRGGEAERDTAAQCYRRARELAGSIQAPVLLERIDGRLAALRAVAPRG